MPKPYVKQTEFNSDYISLPPAELRRVAEISMKNAIERADDKCSGKDEPSIMPWLEVYYVECDDEKQEFSDPMINLYALAIDMEEKAQVLRRIGEGFVGNPKVTIPIAAIFTSEVWVSRARHGAPHIEPRLDPERKDAIVCVATAIDGSVIQARQMLHKAPGKVVPMGKVEWITDDPNYKVASPLMRHFWLGYLMKAAPHRSGPN